MAQALILETTIMDITLDEYLEQSIQEAAQKWQGKRSTVGEKVRASIKKVALNHTSNKLRAELGVLWSPDDTKAGSPTVIRIIVADPQDAEAIEDSLNTATPYIFFTGDGAIITEEMDPKAEGVLYDDVAEWLADVIRVYLDTAVFLAVGSLRNLSN